MPTRVQELWIPGPGSEHCCLASLPDTILSARENVYFKPNDTVVMDKGYVDYAWMNDLNQGGVTFVTRAKTD